MIEYSRIDIQFVFQAESLRNELLKIGQKQAAERWGPLWTNRRLASNPTALQRQLFRDRLCLTIGRRALWESIGFEEWELELKQYVLMQYFEKDCQRATLEQVLVAWGTESGSWYWPQELQLSENQRIRGYGLIKDFYRPWLHMAAFALGKTLKLESQDLDSSWVQEARSYANQKAALIQRYLNTSQ